MSSTNHNDSQGSKNNHHVHFLHIGKTGGTALKHALIAQNRTGRYTIEIHHHNVSLKDIPRGDSVIFFLRDPISRFISGFYSRQRMGKPKYSNPWKPLEKLAFERFDTPNMLANALSSRDTEEQSAARSAMQNINHVRFSYRRWLDNESYLLSRVDDIFFIGFQENLEEDFKLLRDKLELPATVQLPSDEINSHRNPKSLDRTMSPQAEKNLQTWYKRDYDLLDTCKKLRKQLQKQG